MPDLKASLTVSAVDRLSTPARKMAGEVDKLSRATQGMGSTAERASRALGQQEKTTSRVAAAQRQLGSTAAQVSQAAANQGRVAEQAASQTNRLAQAQERLPVKAVTRNIADLSRAQIGLEASARKVTRAYADQSKMIRRLTGEATHMAAAQERMQKRLMAGGGATLAGTTLAHTGQALTRPFTGGLNVAGMFQDFDVEFKVLLGSTAAAQARIRELARFSAYTPFEMPQVVAASRTLETLTKGALATGEGLRLVGDVASGTGQPIEELSMWFGRLYDGIMSGRPVGEAMMRMQEIGAVSGETRTRIEQMLEAGQKGDVVWQVLAKSFSRYSGMMDEKSHTWFGTLSNLSDAWTNFRAAVGKPIIPIVKPFITGLSLATEWLQAFTERFPWLAAGAAIAVGGLGLVVTTAGLLTATVGSLMGAVGIAAYGIEYLGFKSRAAAIWVHLLHRRSLLSVTGLKKLGAQAILTGKMGLVGIGSWIPRLITLATVAIPSVTASLGGVAAAVMAIPGIGWIAAAVTGVAILIWKYWKPIKSFLSGYWDGFREGMSPVFDSIRNMWDGLKDGIAVVLMPFRMIGHLIGKLFAPVEAGETSFQKFGYVAGRVLAFIARTLLWPIRVMGWIGRAISWLSGAFEWGFSKAITFVDWLSDKLTWLLNPAKQVLGLLGKVANVFGFGDDEDKASSAQPRKPVVRTAMAAGALAVTPAWGQTTGMRTLPLEPQPIQAVAPAPVASLQPYRDAPVELRIDAINITINTAAGQDEKEIARLVEEKVSAALRQATQQALTQHRRRNRD